MRQDKSTPRIDEADIADALRSSIGTARSVISDLEDAGFVIMRNPGATSPRSARRSGRGTGAQSPNGTGRPGSPPSTPASSPRIP